MSSIEEPKVIEVEKKYTVDADTFNMLPSKLHKVLGFMLRSKERIQDTYYNYTRVSDGWDFSRLREINDSGNQVHRYEHTDKRWVDGQRVESNRKLTQEEADSIVVLDKAAYVLRIKKSRYTYVGYVTMLGSGRYQMNVALDELPFPGTRSKGYYVEAEILLPEDSSPALARMLAVAIDFWVQDNLLGPDACPASSMLDIAMHMQQLELWDLE